MADTYSTPGVYVKEISVFPPSVVEVETAIPAFIGYTEKADKNSPGDLVMIPKKISSLVEYETYFGKAQEETDDSVFITVSADGTTATLEFLENAAAGNPHGLKAKAKYNMYYCLQHFYDNGGGPCYIVSVDKYAAGGTPDEAKLEKGLDLVAKVDEVTLLVVPEASKIDDPGPILNPPPAPPGGGPAPAAPKPVSYSNIVQKMISQAAKLKDRFALIDPFYVTVKDTKNPFGNIDGDVALIRAAVPIGDDSKYAAAYYPTLMSGYKYNYNPDKVTVKEGPVAVKGKTITQLAGSAIQNTINAAIGQAYVVLPPSAAMAGIYKHVDDEKGVWKAPANEPVLFTAGPSVDMSNDEQMSLNVDPNAGQSIDVIRNIPGRGLVVWGARTLDGNDNDWRYINVRRFFNMVEESVKKSSQWAVFEPNTIPTWLKMEAMIENYLMQKWKDGALAGSKPEQAFYVRVGLGKTMTSQDILEGRMNVEIGMAVSHPAEFIILKFTQIAQQP